MTTIPISKFRSDLSDMANKVAYGGERVCVVRNRKPLFAVVPFDDMEFLEHIEDRIDVELAKKALKSGKFISIKALRKELGL